MTRHRFRIRFRKEGDLRFLGHRDLLRTLERMFRRAELRLSTSQGFHPKPRMSFPAALAVGMIGRDELMELELEDGLSVDELRGRLEKQCPQGLTIVGVEALPPGKKGRVSSMSYEITVPPSHRESLAEKIAELLSRPSHLACRGEDSRPVDIRSALEELVFDGDRLMMRLSVNDQGGARPRAVLEALGLDALPAQGHPLVRTTVELET
jgi:radical SAM-linked protein